MSDRPAHLQEDIGDVLVSEADIAAKVTELGARISADYQGRPVTLGSVLKRSLPFMADLMRAIDLPLRIDLMEVSSYGGNSTESSGLVRILKDLSASIEREDVLIVEDIIDTGLTLNYLVRYLRGKNPASLRICTLLDKPARRLVEIPVGKAGPKVAAFLALTIAPLAVAGLFLVPLLDRAGPRRAISFGAAVGRAVVCLYAAPRFGTLLLFPAAFLLLVLSKVHAITKNGLVAAYAGPNEGLVRANARLGRIAAGGALLAAGPAFGLLELGGAESVLYGAAVAYGITAMLNLRLPHPHVKGGQAEVSKRGAIPQLTAPAIGAAGLRAASGFLLFALAFSLRRSGEPTWWFACVRRQNGSIIIRTAERR